MPAPYMQTMKPTMATVRHGMALWPGRCSPACMHAVLLGTLACVLVCAGSGGRHGHAAQVSFELGKAAGMGDGPHVAVRPHQHAIARRQAVRVLDMAPCVDRVAVRADMAHAQPRAGSE